MGLLRSVMALAVVFVVGYLLGLNAPGKAAGPPRSRPVASPSGAASGPASAGGSRIRFTQELFDFGEVDQGQKVVHVYEFTNAGTAPLEISDVTTSCGCTVTMLSSRTLAPGASGQVRAEFDTAKYHDRMQIWIHLFTNDPRRRQATILLQGKVAAFLRVEPAALDLGEVREGQEVRGSIRVAAARPGERFRITGVRATSDLVSVGPVREDPALPGAAYFLDVSVRGRAPYGILWDNLQVTTDHPKRKSVEVRISRTVMKPGAVPSPSRSPR